MSNRNPRERFDYKSWFERNVAKRTVAALEARDAEFAEKQQRGLCGFSGKPGGMQVGGAAGRLCPHHARGSGGQPGSGEDAL